MTPRRALVATGLAICVYGMQATVLGTLLPEMSKSFTPGQSGTLAAVQSLGMIAASFVTGPAIDRAGAKAGVLCGLTLIAIALFFLPAAHAYSPLLFVMALMGLGGGVISTSSNTMASELGGAHQASTLNLLNVFFGVGGLTTPALGAFLSEPMLCRLIVGIALVAIVLHAGTSAPQTSGGRSFRNTADSRQLLQPLFILLSLFVLLYVAAEVGVWNWLALYLTAKGMPKTQALHVLSFGFAAGIICGRLAASRIPERFPAATITLTCSGLMVLATLALLLTSGAVSAGIAVFCAGLFMGPVYPTTIALVSEAFPRGTATAIGIVVTMGWVGVALSSRIIGSIAGNNPNGLGTALLVIPALSLLMCLVNLTFQRWLPRSAVPAQP